MWKAYDPKLIVGWPTAEIAVMGGEQAAKVLLQIELASLKSKGEKFQRKKKKYYLKISNVNMTRKLNLIMLHQDYG